MTQTLDTDTTDLETAAARAMMAGDPAEARRLLEQAVQQDGEKLDLWMSLAACRRRLGDIDAAIAAVDRALTLDPRAFLPLLMRASLLEKLDQAKAAAVAYGVALVQAPALEVLNEATRRAVLHARTVHAAYLADMQACLDAEVARSAGDMDRTETVRLEKFRDDILGKRTRYRQEPMSFFYPDLPSTEFYMRERFPWIATLEAATDVIEGELMQVLAQDTRGFVPYVDYDESLPLDQWRALNKSPDWSAFHLFANGEPVEANCALCPKTVEVLRAMPQPLLPGRSPAAMFSVLKPKTRIPPHVGVSNTRLVVHLPLIVPPLCRFRVGNETRTWRRGEAWVFDDTIEHEAVNDSDQTRIILIFDVWQPALSASEQAAIVSMTQALDRFRGAPTVSSI